MTSWIEYTTQDLALNSSQRIQNALGGAGFTRAEDEYKFSTLLSQLDADAAVKYVVICGGYNDIWANATAITAGMNACKSIIQTKFPNATMCVGFIGNTTNPDYATNVANTRTNYATCATSIGAVSLNNLNVLTRSNLYSSDGIHPNALGEQLIAQAVTRAMTSQLS